MHQLSKWLKLSENELLKMKITDTNWISNCVKTDKLRNIDSYFIPEALTKKENDRTKYKEEKNESVFKNVSYDCMRRTPLVHKNSELISMLKIIERLRYLEGDSRGESSYSKAISILKAYPKDLESYEEAINLSSIGTVIGSKIGEYLSTGYISEAKYAVEDDRFKVLDLFCKIHGVGPQTASKWYELGYRTIDDLLPSDIKFRKDQKIGLKYFKDFQIPHEVKEIYDRIALECKNTFDFEMDIIVVGGYRRGKLLSNDVDILISPKIEGQEIGMLSIIVDKLEKESLIVDKLSKTVDHNRELKASTSNTFDRLDKCLCAFKLNGGIARRLDLIVVPRSQFAFALLGWSGSRRFERSIREYAKKEKHFHLSSHGIQNMVTSEWIHADSEEDIFSILGLEYIEPEFRNC